MGDVLGEGRLPAVVEDVVAAAAVTPMVNRVLQQRTQVGHTVLEGGHGDAVDRCFFGLEEASFAGEHGVDFGDRHCWLGRRAAHARDSDTDSDGPSGPT